MRLRSNLSLGSIYGMSFRIQAESFFSAEFKKHSIWRIFMEGIGAFRGFMSARLNLSLIYILY